MASMDQVMCRIRAPSGEGNYLLGIRQFLWNHRSEKETDLVIISGKESVKVHQAFILPMSDHPLDLFPPSCPCTKPALCLPPFPNHILTAAVEILYTGKTTMVASRDDHVKIKEVFSLLKIKVDIIADDYEGGNIGRERDTDVAAGGVIVKLELIDPENNNSIKILGQDDQLQDDHSCYINDVEGLVVNDAMRNITETQDKRDELPSSSSSYLNEVTGQIHYHERRNSLELQACQNDKNVDGSHSSSGRYLDEFSNFISLNSGSRSIFTEKVVKTTMRHDTDQIWNDLIKEEPTSPDSQGPLSKLRSRKTKAKETDDAEFGLDGKNILSELKAQPGIKKQKISPTTESSKKYHCCKCNYKTNDKSNLQRHIDSVHQTVSLNCNQCEFKTTHKEYLKRHIDSMHKKISYYCEQCEYKTTRKYRLKVHNDSVHENIFHNCHHCDYKTTWKVNLKTHIESVHEKITYECNECRYKTTRKDYLKLHIKRKHAEVSCPGFQENERAADEETIPEGKNSYYCDQCEYKSTRKYRLKKHIDGVHEKNVFHNCNYCNYKTTWKYNLKTHIESVHEKISYNCNDCDFKTTRKDCLKTHIKSKHAGGSNCSYQGSAKAVNKETFSRELPVSGETSSNFQVRTSNLSQEQVGDVSSKSTKSDDHGPVDDEPYEGRLEIESKSKKVNIYNVQNKKQTYLKLN